MDRGRRAGADLRAEVVESSKGCFSARLFDQWAPLDDGYWFRSRLNQGRGAPAITVAFGVPPPEGPPAGAEVGHRIPRRWRGGQRDTETLPPSGGRGDYGRSSREVCSDASAIRSQPCVLRCYLCTRRRRFSPLSLAAAESCSWLQIVRAAVLTSCTQSFGTNARPAQRRALKSFATRPCRRRDSQPALAVRVMDGLRPAETGARAA